MSVANRRIKHHASIPFPTPIPAAAPEWPARASPDARTTVRACGSAKMQSAPAAPADIPIQPLLQNYAAAQPKPGSALLRRAPVAAAAVLPVPGAHLGLHPAGQPSHGDGEFPSARMFPATAIAPRHRQTEPVPEDRPIAQFPFPRESASPRKSHEPRSPPYQDSKLPQHLLSDPDWRHAALNHGQSSMAIQKASPDRKGRVRVCRPVYLPLAARTTGRNQAAPHEPLFPAMASGRVA